MKIHDEIILMTNSAFQLDVLSIFVVQIVKWFKAAEMIAEHTYPSMLESSTEIMYILYRRR